MRNQGQAIDSCSVGEIMLFNGTQELCLLCPDAYSLEQHFPVKIAKKMIK